MPTKAELKHRFNGLVSTATRDMQAERERVLRSLAIKEKQTSETVIAQIEREAAAAGIKVRAYPVGTMSTGYRPVWEFANFLNKPERPYR